MTPGDWREAEAAFRSAEPCELVRGERTLTVRYCREDGCWTAVSPQLDGFLVRGPSLDLVIAAARAALRDWLDPAVQVQEVTEE